MNWDHPSRGVPLILAVGLGLAVAYNVLHVDPMPWVTEARAAVDLKTLQAESATPAAGGETAPEQAVSPVPEGGNGAPPAVGGETFGIPESQFPINVDLADAKRFFDQGIRVLDARDTAEFEEGHIRGAECTPYDTFGADPDWLEATAADPRPILIYCGGGDCETSLNLGFAINQAGHRRVLVYEGGFPEWEEAGFPVAGGAGR